MGRLCFIFNDQLSESLSALRQLHADDWILFCEMIGSGFSEHDHPKKIAFLMAAQRHFAEELAEKGHSIRYLRFSDTAHIGSLTEVLADLLQELNLNTLMVTEPSEYHLKQMVDEWPERLGIPVERCLDDRFLCSGSEFTHWAGDKKHLRMEYFYREMRKKYAILLQDDGKPVGGQWNYDKENRKGPPQGLTSPKRMSHQKSKILSEVLLQVAQQFPNNFGQLEPFHYAVTRAEALMELDDFIERILPDFGDYQDAMVKGEAYLNHSLLSSYLNVGLLLPLELCQKAEAAYRQNKAPLAAVEGFIRQIMGWREYVRGIYALKMPDYGALNFFDAQRPLPDFYWGAQTQMACISEVVLHTRDHAYSHHIQRLMVTGNFALLAGLDVKQVQAWYLAVYSDAFEWVEMPNTLGMALYGDGGVLASKPYAASGKYINKMSNFCKKCHYDPESLLDANACPFNSLYWDFLARSREKLAKNPRLSMIYRIWDKFTHMKQESIQAKAASVLVQLQKGEL